MTRNLWPSLRLLVSLGMMFVLVGMEFTPIYSPTTCGGPALVASYLGVGFLSVGVFGLLFLLEGVVRPTIETHEVWKYTGGAMVMAGACYLIFRWLLFPGCSS